MKKFFTNYYIVALIFVNATFVFAQETNNFDSIIQIANDKIRLEQFNDAEEFLDSLKTTPEYQIDSVKLKVDLALAILFQKQNKDEQALEILLNGLSDIKSDMSSNYIADYAYEIGSGFSKIENYPKALEYFRLVLKNSIIRNDSLRMSKGYLGLGSVHFRLYREIAYEDFKKDSIVKKTHKDSLQYFYQKSINFYPKNRIDKEFLAVTYTNLLGFNFLIKKYNTAETYASYSLKIYEESGDSLRMASVINTLGAVNVWKKDYKNAKKYYQLGLRLVNQKSDYRSIKLKSLFIRNLSGLHYRNNEYEEAYLLSLELESFNDSIRKVSANEKYAEYEAKYNLAEEEKHTEIEKNKRKSAEMWLYIVGTSTAILLLFVWLFYRTAKIRREKELLLLQKEALTKEREIEQLNNEAQIKILNATIDGKEAERQEIAEILHNSVSALLSSAGLHLQAAKIELKESAPVEISKSQAIVEEAGDKIRDLSHQLISSVLMNFGLGFAMDDLCEKYSNSKLSFKCKSENIQRYSSDFEIKIHSIIDELINNVIKHSEATEAQILLEDNERFFKIKIIDNGKGFDINKIRAKSDVGLGLPQIEARIKMMDGIFEINSSEEIGTHIYMKLPILK